jgi:hypothetical protein
MFRWSTEIDRWAEHLIRRRSDGQEPNPIRTQLDLYYLFAMIGIGRNDARPLDGAVKDIVKSYTDELFRSRYQITGLLVCADLLNSGVKLDKDRAKSSLVKILSTDSSVGLSSEGIELLNQYAHGGYLRAKESLGSKPTSSEDFLLWVHRFLKESCFSSDLWR